MKRLVLILAVVGSLASCTATDPPPSADPAAVVTWGECPTEVEIQFLSRHECGTAAFQPRHGEALRQPVTSMVLKVWPVGAEPERDATGLSFGADYGGPISAGGDIAAGATRSGNVVFEFASRGSATHATPSLACPEVDMIQTAATTDRDPGVRAAFATAVSQCATRLRADGVEPAAFGVAAQTDDREAIRAYLGTEMVGTGTYGTMSGTLLRYIQEHPGRIAFAYLDSPAPIDLDPLTAGVEGLDSALTALAKHHAGLKTAWDQALAVTAKNPLKGTFHGTPVVVDDAKLVRLIRFSLGGDGPANAEQVPAMIKATASSRLDPHLAELAATDPPFCAGYIPICMDRRSFSLGLFLTAFCEQLPSDTSALTSSIAGRPAYEQAFGRSPYLEACQAWNVPSVPFAGPERVDVPLLLMSGEYDSYSRPEWAQVLARRAGDHAWVVTIPGNTHNVLGFSECAVRIRDTWRRRPSQPPDTSCAETDMG